MWTAKVRHKRNGSDGIAEVNDNSATVTYTDGSVNFYNRADMKSFFKQFVELKDGEHCAQIVCIREYRACKEQGLDYNIYRKK